MGCKCGGPIITPLHSEVVDSNMGSRDAAELNSTGMMKSLASSQGCWSSNGEICLYVFGDSRGCFETAAACSSATGKPSGCYEYTGAICEWIIGDNPSNCFEVKGHCEAFRIAKARSVITPLKFLEASHGTCSPDPHCSWKEDRCHCCFNGGCDYEDMCKCGGPAFVPLDSHVEVAD